MKRFLTDSLIFLFLIMIFSALTNSNTTNIENDNISSFDQNIENNIEIEDGYVNGDLTDDYEGNSLSQATNYVSNKVLDVVNGGMNVFKKVLKSFLK